MATDTQNDEIKLLTFDSNVSTVSNLVINNFPDNCSSVWCTSINSCHINNIYNKSLYTDTPIAMSDNLNSTTFPNDNEVVSFIYLHTSCKNESYERICKNIQNRKNVVLMTNETIDIKFSYDNCESLKNYPVAYVINDTHCNFEIIADVITSIIIVFLKFKQLIHPIDILRILNDDNIEKTETGNIQLKFTEIEEQMLINATDLMEIKYKKLKINNDCELFICDNNKYML